MGMIALVAGFDSLSWHEAVKPCFLIVLFIFKAFCIKGHAPSVGHIPHLEHSVSSILTWGANNGF